MKIRWKLLDEDGKDPEDYVVWKLGEPLQVRAKIGDAIVLPITEVSTGSLVAEEGWWYYRCCYM